METIERRVTALCEGEKINEINKSCNQGTKREKALEREEKIFRTEVAEVEMVAVRAAMGVRRGVAAGLKSRRAL